MSKIKKSWKQIAMQDKSVILGELTEKNEEVVEMMAR
jgi:hypothetical protein